MVAIFARPIKSTIFWPGNQIHYLWARQSNLKSFGQPIKSKSLSLRYQIPDQITFERYAKALCCRLCCVDILTKCAAVIKDLIRGGICLLSAVVNRKFFVSIQERKKLLTTAYNDNNNISTDFTNDNKNYAKSLISSGLS